jgi:hypothetical protein
VAKGYQPVSGLMNRQHRHLQIAGGFIVVLEPRAGIRRRRVLPDPSVNGAIAGVGNQSRDRAAVNRLRVVEQGLTVGSGEQIVDADCLLSERID